MDTQKLHDGFHVLGETSYWYQGSEPGTSRIFMVHGIQTFRVGAENAHQTSFWSKVKS